MKYFDSPNVHYLESTEFTPDLQLISAVINPATQQPYFTSQQPVIVMVQGNYCGYCTQFKPAFQQLADELTQLEFATIQIDGDQPNEQIFKDESALTQILRKPLEGVPLVLKFHRGVPVAQYSGAQNYDSLKQWVLS